MRTGLRPEKSGTVIVPGDWITDRHAAIVHPEPNGPIKGRMNFGWLTGYLTPNAASHVPEHARTGRPGDNATLYQFRPDLILLPQMSAPDVDHLG